MDEEGCRTVFDDCNRGFDTSLFSELLTHIRPEGARVFGHRQTEASSMKVEDHLGCRLGPNPQQLRILSNKVNGLGQRLLLDPCLIDLFRARENVGKLVDTLCVDQVAVDCIENDTFPCLLLLRVVERRQSQSPAANSSYVITELDFHRIRGTKNHIRRVNTAPRVLRVSDIPTSEVDVEGLRVRI